jgi:hypothetical protein
LLRDGKGTRRDVGRAKALFRQACDGGKQDSCSALAQLETDEQSARGAGGRQLELFGVPLQSADRARLRGAILRSGPVAQREDDRYWVDLYDPKGVLDGATGLSVAYSSEGQRLAYAMYEFKSFVDPDQVSRIIRMVSTKYGPPAEQRGMLQLGEVTATWRFADGMLLEVSRGWPDTTTCLKFVNPAVERRMKREIDESKDHEERQRARVQTAAF